MIVFFFLVWTGARWGLEGEKKCLSHLFLSFSLSVSLVSLSFSLHFPFPLPPSLPSTPPSLVSLGLFHAPPQASGRGAALPGPAAGGGRRLRGAERLESRRQWDFRKRRKRRIRISASTAAKLNLNSLFFPSTKQAGFYKQAKSKIAFQLKKTFSVNKSEIDAAQRDHARGLLGKFFFFFVGKFFLSSSSSIERDVVEAASISNFFKLRSECLALAAGPSFCRDGRN